MLYSGFNSLVLISTIVEGGSNASSLIALVKPTSVPSTGYSVINGAISDDAPSTCRYGDIDLTF